MQDSRQRLSVSIALCTFNGGHHLASQLESIKNQSRVPDEIVVCDDGSSDGTLGILRRETKDVALPIRLFENETTLGPSANFCQAISLCDKSIVFLCDQDDYWKPDKIEKAVKALTDNPEAGYVFSDAIRTNAELVPLPTTLWTRVKFVAGAKRAFDRGDQLSVLLKRNVVTGATMAFRTELRSSILPIPPEWVHDSWIAILCTALGRKGVALSEHLIQYRQHSNQAIGTLKPSIYQRLKIAYSQSDAYEKDVYKWEALLSRLNVIGSVHPGVLEAIESRLRHARSRLNTRTGQYHKRLRVITEEVISGNYTRYANGWRTVFKDLLFFWRTSPVGYRDEREGMYQPGIDLDLPPRPGR